MALLWHSFFILLLLTPGFLAYANLNLSTSLKTVNACEGLLAPSPLSYDPEAALVSFQRKIFGSVLRFKNRIQAQEMHEHIHPTSEIIYVSKGGLYLMLNDRLSKLSIGDAAIIPAGMRHYLFTEERQTAEVIKAHKAGQRYLPTIYSERPHLSDNSENLRGLILRGLELYSLPLGSQHSVRERKYFTDSVLTDLKMKTLEIKPGDVLNDNTKSIEQMYFIVSGQAKAVLRGLAHSIGEGAYFSLPPQSTYQIANTSPSDNLVLMVVE